MTIAYCGFRICFKDLFCMGHLPNESCDTFKNQCRILGFGTFSARIYLAAE